MRSNIPYGYVYRTTNKINGKSYIGMRMLSKDKSWRQYLGSGKILLSAIEKYGKESFTKALICYADNVDELMKKEFEMIKHSKSMGRAEYNIYVGIGAGGDKVSFLSKDQNDEFRRRVSEGIKRVSSQIACKNSARHEAQYQDFVESKGSKVIPSYKETQSMKITAQNLSAPINWIRRYLKESEIKLNYKMGVNSRSRSEGQKRYYETQKSNKKEIIDYEDLFQIWVIDEKDIAFLEKYLNRSRAVVYRLLKANGLPTKLQARRDLKAVHFNDINSMGELIA